jgi:hypothetical protein
MNSTHVAVRAPMHCVCHGPVFLANVFFDGRNGNVGDGN